MLKGYEILDVPNDLMHLTTMNLRSGEYRDKWVGRKYLYEHNKRVTNICFDSIENKFARFLYSHIGK